MRLSNIDLETRRVSGESSRASTLVVLAQDNRCFSSPPYRLTHTHGALSNRPAQEPQVLVSGSGNSFRTRFSRVLIFIRIPHERGISVSFPRKKEMGDERRNGSRHEKRVPTGKGEGGRIRQG